jgi:hypothetical protein
MILRMMKEGKSSPFIYFLSLNITGLICRGLELWWFRVLFSNVTKLNFSCFAIYLVLELPLLDSIAYEQ